MDRIADFSVGLVVIELETLCSAKRGADLRLTYRHGDGGGVLLFTTIHHRVSRVSRADES